VWQNRHQLLILIPLRWTGLVLLPLNGPADEHAFREAVAELPVVVWAAIACESRAQPGRGVLSARQGSDLEARHLKNWRWSERCAPGTPAIAGSHPCACSRERMPSR
jgi:hypothetical protein